APGRRAAHPPGQSATGCARASRPSRKGRASPSSQARSPLRSPTGAGLLRRSRPAPARAEPAATASPAGFQARQHISCELLEESPLVVARPVKDELVEAEL